MPWLTLQEGVERLSGKVSYATVRRLAISGTVKGTRIGSRILLDQAAFDEYVRNQGYGLIAPATRQGRKQNRR